MCAVTPSPGFSARNAVAAQAAFFYREQSCARRISTICIALCRNAQLEKFPGSREKPSFFVQFDQTVVSVVSQLAPFLFSPLVFPAQRLMLRRLCRGKTHQGKRAGLRRRMDRKKAFDAGQNIGTEGNLLKPRKRKLQTRHLRFQMLAFSSLARVLPHSIASGITTAQGRAMCVRANVGSP